MRHVPSIPLILITMGVVALAVSAQSSDTQLPTQPAGQDNPPTARQRFETRLESLSADEPMAYFKLAEEVADLAGQPADYELARHLFGLAGALAPERLGRSACLALADLESDSLEKQRLLALASLLDERAGGGALYVPEQNVGSPSRAALSLVKAFSYYRRGEGSKTRALVNDEDVLQLMDQHDRLIPGGVDGFLEDARVYRGDMRPDLEPDELRKMLQLELALLTNENRQWSAELALTDGEPLLEVNPNQLAETFGVDPDRPLYRNGRWVSAR